MSGILNVVLTSFGTAGAPVGLLSLYTNPNGSAVTARQVRIKNDILFAVFLSSSSINTGVTITSRLPLDLTGFTWQNELFGNPNTLGIANAVVDSGNNLICVGNENIGSSFQAYLIKFNSSGVVQWQRSMTAGSFGSFFSSVDVDSSNNIYAVGFSSFFNANGDMYSTKWDSSGTVQYQQYIGDTSSTVAERAAGVAVINQGAAPADIFLISGLTGGGGFAFFDTVMYFASMTTGARRSAFRQRDTAGNTRQTPGPCIRGETDSIAYISTMSYAGPGVTTNENAVIVKAQINPSTYSISILGHVALALSGTTTSVFVVDMVMNPAGTHFYVLCRVSDGSLSVAKYATDMTLTWERSVASTGATLNPSGITVDSLDNFYVSFETSGSPASSSILKMPGTGAGVGSTATIGGRTYTYAASTLNTFITLLYSSYNQDPVNQATTPTTPTPTNTASSLTSSVANMAA